MAGAGWLSLANPDRATFLQFTTGGSANYGKYENAVVDRLLRQALTTLEQGKAKELYQSSSRILPRVVPYIFLQYQEYIAMYRDDLTGFVPNPVVNWRSMKDVTISR